MTMRDDAVFLATMAFIHTGPVGSPCPSPASISSFDPDSPDTIPGTGMDVYDHFGHTDLDEDIKSDNEGGDSKVRGTRQRPNMREHIEPEVEWFTVQGVQFDGPTLRAYYGGGVESAGKFVAPATTKAVEKSVVIIYCDGDRRMAEFHERASVRRGGPISREAENFMRAPVRITPLASGNDGATWLNEDAFFDPE